MAKKNGICALCSALIMLLLPWCAAAFADGVSGMAVCLLLFFAVDPIAAICVGVFAGRELKAAWFQPLLLSALFLLGTWVFFDMGERAFLLYAAIYLFLGYAVAAIAAVLGRKKG